MGDTKTQFKSKGFTKIGRIIPDKAKSYKLETSLHKYQAIKHWEKVAGGFIKEAEKLTKAVDLQKGILVVACLSKEVAYQIKLLAQRIIYALNQLIGKLVVFAIQVEV